MENGINAIAKKVANQILSHVDINRFEQDMINDSEAYREILAECKDAEEMAIKRAIAMTIAICKSI